MLVVSAVLLAGAACQGGRLSEMGTAGSSGHLDGAGGGVGILGAGGAAGGPNCGEVDVATGMVQTDILILLDRSASMNDDTANTPCDGGCGATSKWAQAAAAIDRIVGDTEDHVNWGLKWFPDSDNACGVFLLPTVGVGPFNHDVIVSELALHTTSNGGLASGGNTPTRAAVAAAHDYLGGVVDANRKLILLVTDGAPDCRQGASDVTADDSTATDQAVNEAQLFGYPTIVVGIGTAGGPADATLNELAQTGYQASPDGPPFYYPVTDAGDMTTTLQGLVKSAADCVFALPPPPNENLDVADIQVKADDAYVSRDYDHVSGWDYTDNSETAIQIYGPVCDAFISGQTKNLSIAFLCII